MRGGRAHSESCGGGDEAHGGVAPESLGLGLELVRARRRGSMFQNLRKDEERRGMSSRERCSSWLPPRSLPCLGRMSTMLTASTHRWERHHAPRILHWHTHMVRCAGTTK
jgi:hypothetical protein